MPLPPTWRDPKIEAQETQKMVFFTVREIGESLSFMHQERRQQRKAGLEDQSE